MYITDLAKTTRSQEFQSADEFERYGYDDRYSRYIRRGGEIENGSDGDYSTDDGGCRE